MQTIEMTMEDASLVDASRINDCSRDASGVMALMEKYSTFLGMKISILLFSMAAEQLSSTL